MIAVRSDEDGSRLDRWLMQQAGVSFVQVQKWIRTGQVRVDGKRVKADTRLLGGQVVRIPPVGGAGAARGGSGHAATEETFAQRQAVSGHTASERAGGAAPWAAAAATKAKPTPPRSLTHAQRQTIRDAILYRDEHLLILNKPYGLAVQGGSGTTQHLDDWLKLWGAEEGVFPRLTHRLDRETSGVLAVALTREAAAALAGAFRHGTAEKTYWAVVVGVPPQREGLINLRLAKAENGGQEMMLVSEDGKPAITRYEVRESLAKQAAWLELHPEQGRTHQLRVHCAASGFPIQGDRKYGRREAFLSGAELSQKLHLHARQLVIRHPVTGEKKSFIAPLPSHMQTTWELFGWDAGKAG